jgi:undecaprenyl phosphate-alpha-L-ara4N flippase subunit ArnE
MEPSLLVALGLCRALLMWLHVLSKIHLSAAYPILAVTYVMVSVLTVLFFDEQIGQSQLIGKFLILASVAMIGQDK